MDEYTSDNTYNFLTLSQAIKKANDLYNDTNTDTSDLLYNSNVIVNYEI